MKDSEPGRIQGITAPVVEARPSNVEALFRDHAVFVANFLARLGVAPQDVEDLVQEVFLVAHQKGGYTPGAAKPSTWLAEIATRVASRRRQSAAYKRAVDDPEAIARAAASGASPLERADARASLKRVEDALSTLDVGRRAVFVLFEIEGESCEEIARALGIPIGTVYSRLHAAREVIKRCYAPPEAEGHCAVGEKVSHG